MKTFYNEYNAAVCQDAQVLGSKARVFVHDLMQEFIALGYNPREISRLIQDEASLAESEIVLRTAMAKRKAEKALDKR